MGATTAILNGLSDPERPRAEEAWCVIYNELRRMAAAKMRGERPDHTLGATELVNEALLRLIGSEQKYETRGHFYKAASEAMRRILIEYARRRLAKKRNGGIPDLPLDESIASAATEDEKLLQVHEALHALEEIDAVQAEVVKMIVFARLKQSEVAQLLDMSKRTVRRHWSAARLWLYHEIKGA